MFQSFICGFGGLFLRFIAFFFLICKCHISFFATSCLFVLFLFLLRYGLGVPILFQVSLRVFYTLLIVDLVFIIFLKWFHWKLILLCEPRLCRFCCPIWVSYSSFHLYINKLSIQRVVYVPCIESHSCFFSWNLLLFVLSHFDLVGTLFPFATFCWDFVDLFN